MSPKKVTLNSARGATAPGKAAKGFSDEERGAMKARVEELKAEERRGPNAKKADGEDDVLAKIAEMPDPDRVMADALPVNRAGAIRDQRYLQILTRRVEDAGVRADRNDETEQQTGDRQTPAIALRSHGHRSPFSSCRHAWVGETLRAPSRVRRHPDRRQHPRPRRDRAPTER